jgi:hypothetical protein
MELKWYELQAQAQQMSQVKQPLLVCLTSEMLLGIIGILAWGVGFIPQSAWAHLEKYENLVEAIRTSKHAYVKPLKVAWGTWHWTLKSNKCNQAKEMDAISKYQDFKIIHGRYISYLYI